MNITLRTATTQDQAVLLAIFASTRADEMTLTGWPSAQIDAFLHMQYQAQRRHYEQHNPRAEVLLILDDGEAVGRLWIDRRETELHVLDISLLLHARGRGIGTQCLRALMQEAAARAAPLSIYVEQGNPARRLYERLGFEPEGDLIGIHQGMAWHPVVHHLEESLS